MRCGSPDLMPGSRRYCSAACQMAVLRAPRKLAPIFTCPDCGVEFQAVSRKGRTVRRCPDCAAAHKKATNARLYAEMSPERVAEMRAKGARWSKEHPEYARAMQHRRRALRYQAPIEDFLDGEIFERDGWICQLCEEPVDRVLLWPHPFCASLDHIVPLSRGGHHVHVNCQLAHLRCNIRKGASLTPPDEEVVAGG
jgi:5-methylcytosine-specific restriction endonuclease McrA